MHATFYSVDQPVWCGKNEHVDLETPSNSHSHINPYWSRKKKKKERHSDMSTAPDEN